ncbi:MAG: amidohydrolase family protein [Saprospiraceae bacterium]|nr:amidohydrolase family protein [Saprospiraceae bacterium]
MNSRGFLLLVIFLPVLSMETLHGQFKTKYPDVPRIDVHTHVAADVQGIANYLALRTNMLERHDIDFALWINLGDRNNPLVDPIIVEQASEGRMLCSIADYAAHDGLDHDPDSLQHYLDAGFVGYKIWSGPWYRRLEEQSEGHPYIDDLAHEPTFAEMERIGMVGASVHIADPNGPWGNRGDWLADPVEYWKEITAWTRVLEKHPDLVVVMAHGNWLLCQDAQIDYLRYLLTTFPNLNIDLAATFQYFHLVQTENLRAFMIEWADRILYATDIGKWTSQEQTTERMEQYLRTFQILETDKQIAGGFFGGPTIPGLNLPKEVLEKIYFKNAARLYPRVKEQLIHLGYELD